MAVTGCCRSKIAHFARGAATRSETIRRTGGKIGAASETLLQDDVPTRRTNPAISTLARMGIATIVITVAASSLLIEPAAFHAFGITGQVNRG